MTTKPITFAEAIDAMRADKTVRCCDPVDDATFTDFVRVDGKLFQGRNVVQPTRYIHADMIFGGVWFLVEGEAAGVEA